MPSDMMLAGTAVMPVEFVMAWAGLMMTVLIGPEGAAFFSARNLLPEPASNVANMPAATMLFFQYLNIFISPSFYDLVFFRLRLVSGTGGGEGLLPSERGPAVPVICGATCLSASGSPLSYCLCMTKSCHFQNKTMFF